MKKTSRIPGFTWLLLLAATPFLITSCAGEDEFPDDLTGNFDALWNLIDSRYCYFAEKNIDWDEVYSRYRPLAGEATSDIELFSICSAMLDELQDGHVNLSSLFNTSYYRKWWSDYPQDFNLRTLQEYYLKFNYWQTTGISYCAFDKTGYMYYPSFSSGIGETNLDYILALLSDCDALIIDIRNNGGGLLTNIRTLVSRFVTSEIPGGTIRHKTGPGHSDFSEPFGFTYSPAEEGRICWDPQKPVLVLTNRSCYSAANDFVAIMKTLPNVRIVGARTGGGGGLPFSSSLPNGWKVRLSASPIEAPDGSLTEFGIDPSEGCEVHCTDEELARGKDAILDFALALLSGANKF